MMKIGLIAGSGQFPLIFSQKAVQNGYSVYAVGLMGEADPSISSLVTSMEWVNLGQIRKLVNFFKKNGVSHAVMLGAVNKTQMFTNVEPDMLAIAVFSAMDNTQDDALLRAFANVIWKEGIDILPSTQLLPDLLAEKGCWTRRKPTADELADIRFGYAVSKKIGELDIGQSVVVAGGSVLAVEAIDGTDATIKRGAGLSRGQGVVVKTSKPGQDMRFDVPAVGVDTIGIMQSAGIKALAVEAGKTIVFDKEDMIALADEFQMTIVAVDKETLEGWK
jgi:UDP-2,3-diacylglucosamine hydrolase